MYIKMVPKGQLLKITKWNGLREIMAKINLMVQLKEYLRVPSIAFWNRVGTHSIGVVEGILQLKACLILNYIICKNKKYIYIL